MFEVIVFSAVGGLFSLSGVILLLQFKKVTKKFTTYATSFAAGILLAAAFGDLLPEALEQGVSARMTMIWALLGVLGFFLLERFLHWFHHHPEQETEAHDAASNTLVIMSDTLHNTLDGVAIGAAFLINVPTGIIAAIAVALHEIPQEIGDFGLLLKNGMSKKKVIYVNIISSLATVVAAVTVFSLGGDGALPLDAFLAITAGLFIYIAASDIIPDLHVPHEKNVIDWRPWLLLLGVAVMLGISPIAHQYMDTHHEHEESSEVDHDHDDHD